MIDFKIRKNSNIVIIVSTKLSENALLMRALKLTIENMGLNLDNVSFGFYDKISEDDLSISPINQGLCFSNIKTKVFTNNSRNIFCLPPLEILALSHEIQKNELYPAVQKLSILL